MLFPQSIKTACRTFSGKHADSDLQKLSRTLETLLALPDQTVYYIGIVSSVVPWILSYSHIPSYTSHRAVCWFNIMREEHMLSPQRAGRACWTFSGKHADNDLPELSRTLETLLVLPEQTVYHIESLITVHRCIPKFRNENRFRFNPYISDSFRSIMNACEICFRRTDSFVVKVQMTPSNYDSFFFSPNWCLKFIPNDSAPIRTNFSFRLNPFNSKVIPNDTAPFPV